MTKIHVVLVAVAARGFEVIKSNSKSMQLLLDMGFEVLKSNSSLFIWKGLVCILLYVDNLVITGPDLT